MLARALLIITLLPAPALAQDAGARPAAAQPRVTSPEVGPDRRVTFRLLAPKVTSVVLTGEMMTGSKNLERDARGLWTVTVGPLEPEIYHYNFTIDGVRGIDPGNPNVKTGSTAGTIASVLEVAGDSPAFYDAQDVPHGEIRTHWYQSRSLGSVRRLTVYTPPGYDRSKTRYPVLYLLHGANADETAWHRLGHANLILDNLLAAKGTRSKPFIVVMPFGYGVIPGAPAAPGQNTAQFGKDLLEDVIPFIQGQYRTRPDRDHRALVGLSMGGGQALSIGLNHRELFAYVGGFSSGLGRPADFPRTYAGVIADPKKTNKEMRLVWVGCGKEDGAFGGSKSLSEFLTAHDIKHTFHESPGAHTWMVWRHYLDQLSPLLFVN